MDKMMTSRHLDNSSARTERNYFAAPIGLVALCTIMLGTAQAKEAEHSVFADKVDAAMRKPNAAAELFALRNEAPSQPARQFLVVASCADAIRQGKMDLMHRFARTEFGEMGTSKATKMLSRKCSQCIGAGEVQIPCEICKGSGKCSRCNGKGKVKVESTKTRNYLDKSHVDKDGQTISGRTVHGAKQLLGDYDASNVWIKCPQCPKAGNMAGKCGSCKGEGTIAVVCPKCKGEKTFFDKDYAAGLVREKVNVVKSKAKVAETMLEYARSVQMDDTNNAIFEATAQIMGAYGRQANTGRLGGLYKFASQGNKATGVVFAYCVLNGFASYEKLVKDNERLDQSLISDWFSRIDPFAIDPERRKAAMLCFRDLKLMQLAGRMADFMATDLIPEHINSKRELAAAQQKYAQTMDDYARCLQQHGYAINAAKEVVWEANIERGIGAAFGMGSVGRPVMEGEETARSILNTISTMKRDMEIAKENHEVATKRESELLKHLRELTQYGSHVAKTYLETGRFVKMDDRQVAFVQSEAPEKEVKPIDFDYSVFSDKQVFYAIKLLGSNIQETAHAEAICSSRNEELAQFIQEHSPVVSEQDRQIANTLTRKTELAVRNAETLVSQSKRLFQYIEAAAHRGVTVAKTIVNMPGWSGSQSVSISLPSLVDAEVKGDAVREQEEKLMAELRNLSETAIQSGKEVMELSHEYYPVVYFQFMKAFSLMRQSQNYFQARIRSKSVSAYPGAQKRYFGYCKEILDLQKPMIEFLKTAKD